MAHKYRVELSMPGYGGKRAYAFFADSLLWRGGSTLYAKAGAAEWRIINVVRCVNVTTGKDFAFAEVVPDPFPEVEPLTRPPAVNIIKAERKALHSLLYCHVCTGAIREVGLGSLVKRLTQEFGEDDVPALEFRGHKLAVLA